MRFPAQRRYALWPRAVAGLVMALCLSLEAGAVVTTTGGYSGTRTLTLRVGTPTTGAVDTVQFNVGGAGNGNSLPAANSVGGNGTPIAASSGGVVISMIMQVPPAGIPQPVTTTVTPTLPITCTGGGCGSTIIPFSKISWTAATGSADDFQPGTFGAIGTPQTIQSGLYNGAFFLFIFQIGGTYNASSTLNFTYANDVAYPAGNYSGTVTYTATLP